MLNAHVLILLKSCVHHCRLHLERRITFFSCIKFIVGYGEEDCILGGVAAFITLEESYFVEKNRGNGSINVPSSADGAKSDRKSEKKKKVSLGKGTNALVQFIKERFLGGTTKYDLDKFAEDFHSLLNPRDSGFDELLKKVKEIVESNESRRLPKL